jgi:hypothetical protein
MTRCKFTCTEVKPYGDQGSAVKMEPVYAGSEENKEFFSYTPSGHIELGIINPAAAKQFEPGKEYYIDIQEA